MASLCRGSKEKTVVKIMGITEKPKEKSARGLFSFLGEIASPRSVYIAFEAFPRPKGATTHIGSMVSALSVDYSPVLLLCCGYGDMPAFQTEGDVTIIRFKGYHSNFLQRTLGFGSFVFDCLKSLKNHPEICVFRDPWGGIPAIEALHGVPTIFEVNGLPTWELKYTYPDFTENAAAKAKISDMENLCLKRSDAILTVSPVTREALEKRRSPPTWAPPPEGGGKNKIQVIPNCAGDVFFKSSVRNKDCPVSTLEFPELAPDKYFGYFGSSHTWQGLDTLLRAWKLAEKDLPEKKLLIVLGGGVKGWKPVRKLVQKLEIDDRVVFHTSLNPEKLAMVLSRMAFTCSPLVNTERNVVQGCCPIKIVESMAAGIPVLASNLEASRFLITDGFDGRLAEPDDCRHWANLLIELFQDEKQRRLLGQNAFRTAERRFSRTVAEKALIGLFRKTAKPISLYKNSSL